MAGGSLAERHDGHQHSAARTSPDAVALDAAGALRRARGGLIEPPRPPNLTPQRERLLELGLDLRPRLRAPARVQHHAQHTVDAEPGVPRAAVSFNFPFSHPGVSG
jgi:hypothetical protein